jgi:3-oxoadipate enol-lactonase
LNWSCTLPTAKVADLDVAYDTHGSGEPVLMINGIGAERAGWGMQVPAISREFTAITFDNRDVGETGPGRASQPYAMRRLADDAAGLLDALGIASAHIVGASMGGCIAQEFAVSYPQRTRSTTIICSWPQVDPWLDELWEQWEHLFRALGPVEWSRATWLWVFTHRAYRDPGLLDSLLAAAGSNPRNQTLEMYLRQSHAARTFDILDRLGGISAPTHVICGEEDIFTPRRYSETIAAAIPGAKLSVMPGVGHGMFWEATDIFNQLVIEFIRENV